MLVKVNWLQKLHLIRDVTKFEFEFDDVWTSIVFNRFKIQRMFQVLCCWMRIRGKILVVWLTSYAQRATECRQTFFFLKFNLSQNYSHWLCSIIFAQWCVTLY